MQIYLHEKTIHFQTTSISKEMDLTVISIEPRLDSYKKAHFSSKDNESGPSIGNRLFSFHFYSCRSIILCGFAHDMALFAQ